MKKKRSAAKAAEAAAVKAAVAECAAALAKLDERDRSAPHDSVGLVLDRAEWVIEVTRDQSTRTFVLYSRAFLRTALETVDDPYASAGDRRRAVDVAIRAAFQIGEWKGALQQALHARADTPRARAERMQQGRAKSAAESDAEAEARQALERKILANPRTPGKKSAGWVRGRLQEQGVSVSLSTVQRDLKDL